MEVKTHTLDENKRSVVYEVPCKDCHHTYIGETKRILKVKIEQKQAVKLGDSRNWIAVHSHEQSHAINCDGAIVKNLRVWLSATGKEE